MDEEIKMNYPKVEAAIAAFRNGGNKLNDARIEIQSMAKKMSEGSLNGQAGEAFVAALNDKLAPALERLRAKFEETANDLQHTMDDLKRVDKETAADIYN